MAKTLNVTANDLFVKYSEFVGFSDISPAKINWIIWVLIDSDYYAIVIKVSLFIFQPLSDDIFIQNQ